MANTIEFILKAVDKMSPTLNKVQSTTGKAVGFMEKNWVKVGAATAGAALALNTFAKSQAPLLESSRKLANALDMTEKEVRDLALATTNVTFPLNEVFDIMEKGRQQGIKSAEGLKEYATFWDMVGDATGENSVALAESSVALRAVGIAAGEEKEALDAFGYIAQETSGSVGGFINSLGRMAPELRELGMDINDTAGLLGAMEKELGLTARMARQEFRKAVNESNGDMGKLLETLGLTEEQFKQYRAEVEASSGVIENNAIAHEKSYTAIDKIKQKISEVSLKIAPYIEQIANLAPVLIAVGPAMKIFVGAHKAMTFIMSGAFIPAIQSAIVWLKAMYATLLAHPFGWIVIAIGAVIAVIVLLYKNWEKVVNFISNSLDWLAEKFNVLVKPINWIKEKLGLVKDEAEETEKAIEKVGDTTEETAGKFDDSSKAMENSEEMARLLEEANYDLRDSYNEAGEGAKNLTDKNYDLIDSALGAIRVYDDLDALEADTSAQFEDYVKQMEKEREEYEKQKAENKEKEMEALKQGLEEYLKQKAEFEDKKKGLEEYEKQKAKPLYKIIDSDGNIIGATNMPQDYAGQNVTLEKMHTGGIYKAPTPGGEGLVWLKDQETVRTPAQERALGNNVTISISPGAVQFTGTTIDEKAVRNARNILFDNMTEEMRRRGLSFA